jgi:hypothetical protein
MSENATQSEQASQKEHECFCMGAGPEMFAMFKKLGPDSARRHFRNARIEMLKGMRELINKRIDDLAAETPEKKGTKVAVE